MNTVKKIKWAYIVMSVLMIALGIIITVFPNTSMITVCYFIGAVMTVFGTVKIISYFSKDMFRLAFQFDLSLGIFSLAAGLLILFHPFGIATVIPIIIGISVLIDGTFRIQTARDAKKFGMSGWWIVLVLAVLTCLVGIFLIVSPLEGAAALMVTLGITLIVDGVQNLCVVAYTVRAFKQNDELNDDTVYTEFKDVSDSK